MPRDLRTDRLHILLTDEERTAVDDAAERDHETVSTWIRRAIREKLLREEEQRLGVLPGGKRRHGSS